MDIKKIKKNRVEGIASVHPKIIGSLSLNYYYNTKKKDPCEGVLVQFKD
tara:strand:- start:409 stop:555 length:147 start_codon:yes stop_codon:yes gene_type:complete